MNILNATRILGRKGMHSKNVIKQIRRSSEEPDSSHLIRCFAVIGGAVGLGYGYKQIFPEGTNKIRISI